MCEAQSDRAERVDNYRKILSHLLKVGHYTKLFDSLSLPKNTHAGIAETNLEFNFGNRDER
jgi:hypothetical protein